MQDKIAEHIAKFNAPEDWLPIPQIEKESESEK